MIIGSQMLGLTISDFGTESRWFFSTFERIEASQVLWVRRPVCTDAAGTWRSHWRVPVFVGDWLPLVCLSLSRTRGGKRWARASSTASPCPASPPRSPSTTATGTACCRPTSSRWGDPGATYGPRESGVGGEGRESCIGLKRFTCSCRPGVSGSPLKRFMWLFLGAEGLLRSPHVRAAVQPRPFYPHQLDGPRRQRLLLVLQRLSPPSPTCAGRTLKDGGPRWRDQLSARGVPASNQPVTLIPLLTPRVCFSFIYRWVEILDFAVEAFITVRRRRGNKSVRSIKMLSMQHVMVNS